MTSVNTGGATLKQMALARFWKCLDAYKAALQTKKNIVCASLAIHSAQGADGVPKTWKRFVRQAWLDNTGEVGTC